MAARWEFSTPPKLAENPLEESFPAPHVLQGPKLGLHVLAFFRVQEALPIAREGLALLLQVLGQGVIIYARIVYIRVLQMGQRFENRHVRDPRASVQTNPSEFG